MATNNQSSDRLGQPRLAEIVAARLRESIVDGEIADGALLPALDGLVNRFGVSAPSVREALRILENERLITVRRGNVGGAVVHRPKAESVAYTLGLVLQSSRTPTSDLAVALVQLEEMCVGMCARRSDRVKQVVSKLRTDCKKARASSDADDVHEFERWSRQFHADIISGCGNESLILVVGALEQLWAAQSEAWTYRVAYKEESPDPALRAVGIEAHEAIADAIEAGDAELAEQRFREHVEHLKIYRSRSRSKRVRATDMAPNVRSMR